MTHLKYLRINSGLQLLSKHPQFGNPAFRERKYPQYGYFWKRSGYCGIVYIGELHAIIMRRFILSTLLILCSELTFGQTWVKTSLNEQVSIDFPTAPDVQEVGNKKVYQIENADYIVNVLTADMSLVPNFDIGREKLNDFYKGVINGKLDAATNAKFLGEKKIDLDTYEGREIEYTKDFNGFNDIKVTGRIILINKVFYTFEIWDLTGKGQRRLTKKFFKSISVR